MKFLKKSVALLLSIALILTLLPATFVSAEEADTEENTFELHVQDDSKIVMSNSTQDVSFDLWFKAGSTSISLIGFDVAITAEDAYFENVSFTINPELQGLLGLASYVEGVVSLAYAGASSVKTIASGEKVKLGTISLSKKGTWAAGTVGLSFSEGTDASNKVVHAVSNTSQENYDVISFVTDATINIIAPNSIVISGDDEVHIPEDYDYDNDMFSVTLNTEGGYSATYYGTDGVESSKEITWSLGAETDSAYFGIDSTDNENVTLKIKKTTPAGASCTLVASTTGTDGAAVTATKTITITKDASVPKSCTVTVKKGETTVIEEWSGSRGSKDISYIEMNQVGGNNFQTLPSPTEANGAATYTVELKVYDQYGTEVTDFGPRLQISSTQEGITCDSDARTFTVPVGHSTVNSVSFMLVSNKYTKPSINGNNSWDAVHFEIKVQKDDTVATTVEIDPASATIVIPTGDAAAHQEFTATVKDQYGDLMTDRTVTWSLSNTDSYVTGAAGTTDKTYTVFVNKDAQVTTTPLTLTAKVGDSVTGTASVTLAKLDFGSSLPTPASDKLIYGYSPDEIFGVKFYYDGRTDADTITAKLGEVNVEGTYSIYAAKMSNGFGEATLNTNTNVWTAGKWYYKILFTSTDGKYKDVPITSGEFTMATMPIKVSGITAKDKEYNGNTDVTLDVDDAKLSVAESVATDTLQSVLQADMNHATYKLYLASATGQTADKNAGEEKHVNNITLTLSEQYNDKYDVSLAENQNVTVNITPKPVTVTGITATDRQYNGSATYDIEFVATGATVVGKVDGDDVAVDVSKATGTMADANVGTNKPVTVSGVTLSGADAGNYTLSAQPTGVTINISQHEIDVPESKTATYNNSNIGLYSENDLYTRDGVYIAKNVGEYTATMTLKDPVNRKWKIGETQTDVTIGGENNAVASVAWSITKANAQTLLGQTRDVMYSNTGEQAFYASEIAKLLDDNKDTTAKITGMTVVDSYNILDDERSVADDGSAIFYSLKADLTSQDKGKTATITINYESNNYAGGTITLTVTVVDKNQATVTFGDAEFKTYTGSAQKPNAPTVTLTSGTADTGNISYTVKKDGSDFAAGFEGMVDAGTYTITATYEDDSNYGTESTTFTISPAELTVSGGTATKVYDGDPQATDIAGETLTCTTVTNPGLTKGTDYTISNVAFEDANAGTGKTVTYTVRLNDTAKAKNYTLKDATEGVLTVTTTGTITPMAVTVTVNAIADQTYNHGAAIEPEVSVTATGLVGSDTLTAGTDYTVSYSSNTTVGTAAVTIGSVTGSNYTVTGTGSFKIKAYVVALPTVKTEALTFNGEVQTGIDASKDSAYYTITGDTATNAGTHTATVTLKDQNNYVWDVTPAAAENQTINWSIAQASAPNSLKNVEKSYKYSLTGAQTAQISGVPNNAGTDQYSVPTDFASEYVKDVSVSESGLVSFTLIGQSEYNEEAETEIPVEVTMTNYVTTTVKVVITFTDKETPTVTVQNITKTYDGKTLTNSDIKGTASVAGSWQFVESTDSMINADTYEDVAVKFVPTDAVNYSEVEKTITVTINKATPTITVETETEDGKLVVKADKDAETFGEVLTSANFGVSGTLTWSGKDSDGNAVAITGDTKLEDVDLDSVTWTFNPTDTTNYEPVTGGISQETSSNWWIIGAIAGGSGKSSPLDDFTDLDKDAWYAEAVEYCLDEGLMSGTGNGKFSPNGGMTRAMVWTVLGRLSGQSFNGTGANWYADAQKWAVRAGISDGTNPNGQITREELVTMLWRFAGSPKADVSALRWYGDSATISDWAREAMAWAASCSLVEGSNWNLTPGAVATRCQVAAIFMRYHKN